MSPLEHCTGLRVLGRLSSLCQGDRRVLLRVCVCVTRVACVWTGALGRGGCFAPLGVRYDTINNVWRAQVRGMKDTPGAGRGMRAPFRDHRNRNLGVPCLATTVAVDAAVGSKCSQVTTTALGIVICAVPRRQRGLHGRQHSNSLDMTWAQTHPTTRP